MTAIFRTWMGHRTLLSCAVALLIPLILYQIKRVFRSRGLEGRLFFIIMLLMCSCAIIELTILHRSPSVQETIPPPFWSYRKIRWPDIRWQIYMNIFLFIPFGFLIPLSLQRNFWQTVLIAILFSGAIEAVQFHTGLGYCEFDDLFHNVIGAGLGYAYWKRLNRRYTIKDSESSER